MLTTSFARRCENLFRMVRPGGSVRARRAGRGSAATKRRLAAAIEAVESRIMLSVTSTTPVPVTVIEGTAFKGEVMDFTADDAGSFIATIDWGDATAPTLGTVSPKAGGGFEVDASGTPHTYAEDGSYTVSVLIIDSADATSASNTTTATVNESTLTAVGTNISATEGTQFSGVTGTFTDPGSPDGPSEFTASIDWGDGTTTAGTITGSAGSYAVSGTHTYADEGSFQVTTTFFENNDSGFSISVGGTATVAEADVFSNGAITAPASTEQSPITNAQVATFSDSGYPANVAADMTATIDWGDGTTTPGAVVALGGGNFGVNGSHTYTKSGALTMTVTVSDDAPGTATLTITGPVNIADQPITASPVAIDGIEGSPLTNIDVATFTDGDAFGKPTDFIATVNWGDGTTTAGTIVEDASGTFHVEGSHTYVKGNASPWNVTVNIVDDGDGRAFNDPNNPTASTVSSASIVDLPISASGRKITGAEGRLLSKTVASFTDPNLLAPASDFSAKVNWGDGHTTADTVVKDSAGHFHVVGNHAYAEQKTYAVKVSITDAGGSSATASGSAVIADSPLDSAAGLTLNKSKNVAFTKSTLGTFRDQDSLNTNPGDYKGPIDWGDGSAKSAANFVFNGATFNVGSKWKVQGSHKYTNKGTFTVRITVSDSGGKPLTITAKIIVS
jgi:PKD repeat protein